MGHLLLVLPPADCCPVFARPGLRKAERGSVGAACQTLWPTEPSQPRTEEMMRPWPTCLHTFSLVPQGDGQAQGADEAEPAEGGASSRRRDCHSADGTPSPSLLNRLLRLNVYSRVTSLAGGSRRGLRRRRTAAAAARPWRLRTGRWSGAGQRNQRDDMQQAR